MRFFDFLDTNLGKNIILFIIYILVILSFLAFYFMPIMQHHKIQTLDYKRIQRLDNTISQNENALLQNMDALLKENINIHQNMKNNLHMQDLEDYTRRYINDAIISDNGMRKFANNIKIQNITINGYTKHTKEIMDFIENLKSLDYSIRIGFPIDIAKQGENLKVNLSLDIYYSDYGFYLF